MNIYLVSRTDKWTWDDFDSFVVVAKTPEDAANTHPYYDPERPENEEKDWLGSNSWVRIQDKHTLVIKLVGKATEEYQQRQIICASFNAG